MCGKWNQYQLLKDEKSVEGNWKLLESVIPTRQKMLARLKNIEWKKLCKEKIWKQKKKQGSLDKQKAKAKKKKKYKGNTGTKTE